MHADVEVRLLGDLAEEVDRVRLESGDVRIGVEGVDTAGGMPRGTGSEDVPLDDGNIRPAVFGQVIQHAGADDSSADHHDPILILHHSLLLRAGTVDGLANVCGERRAPFISGTNLDGSSLRRCAPTLPRSGQRTTADQPVT